MTVAEGVVEVDERQCSWAVLRKALIVAILAGLMWICAAFEVAREQMVCSGVAVAEVGRAAFA